MLTRIESTDKVKQTQPTNGVAKKLESVKLDGAAAPSQSKLQSHGFDVPKLWEARNPKRKSAAFVVIGHVDHGKSTLMGRLLLDTGAVSQRDIDKYGHLTTILFSCFRLTNVQVSEAGYGDGQVIFRACMGHGHRV